MIYYFHSFPEFSRQIEYTFRNIFCILKVNAKRIDSLDYDFDKNDIVVIYTDKTISLETKHISIMNSKSLFGEHYGSKEVMDNISVLKKSEFVSLFREPGTKEIHNFYGENCVQSNMDLIADIFFTLTRYEEYEAVMHSVRDEFKRYRIENSILFKNDLIHRPIVDEQIELLKKMLIYLDYKIVFRNGAYLFVSHDIDSLRKYHNFYTVRTDLLNKIVWGKFTSFLSLLIKILCARKDPYFNIISIIKKEKKIKINSSFYFMHNKSKNNADYNFESKRIQKLIREMNRYNVEMGYHVSIDENIREMKKHVSNHNKSVELEYGAREHYLQVNPPFSLRKLEKCNILYDTSFSFAEHEGFRCGTTHPFKTYDLLKNREMNLWEIPLIIMDVTLVKYRKMTPDIVKRTLQHYGEIVKKYHGVYTILWHNNRFSEKNWQEYNEIYYSFIAESVKRQQMISKNGTEIIHAYQEDMNNNE